MKKTATLPHRTPPSKSKRVHLFISCRAEDRKLADEIERLLCACSKRLKVHIYPHSRPGSDWEDWIRDKLRISHLLLLLFTDPDADWDWCLYEAGLFTPLRQRYSKFPRPIVCLHGLEEVPPRQLRSLRAIQADAGEIEDAFLRPLLKTPDLTGVEPVLAPRLGDKRIERTAAGIAKLFLRHAVTDIDYRGEYFVIEIPRGATVTPTELPPRSVVLAPEGFNRVLGWKKHRFSWAELTRRAQPTRGKGKYWIEEIAEVICKSIRRESVPLMTSTFRAEGGGHIYRPLLTRIDRRDGEPFRFHFFFNQEIRPEVIRGPDIVGELFNYLTIGNRLRFEVAEPYIKRLHDLQGLSEQDRGRLLRQIGESLEVIEDESQRLDLWEGPECAEVFGDDGQRALELLREREHVKVDLRHALATKNLESLKAMLERLRSLSARVLNLATESYHELIAQNAAGWLPFEAAQPPGGDGDGSKSGINGNRKNPPRTVPEALGPGATPPE